MCISQTYDKASYIIFHDSTLRGMCHSRPEDAWSMLAIPGVGETKFKKYGEQFLEAIKKHQNEQLSDA
ncbi:MAG: HRDC domain-containing protein [Bacillota bacterium]|jgi:ATP-dependent DNA helicase RecQ